MSPRISAKPLTIALALLAAAITGYGLLAFGPLDFPWQRASATMHLEATVDGDTVRVNGATDLPDGALIDYWLWRDDAINEGPTGATEVDNGEFLFEHDVSGLRRGVWEIQASFSTVWGSTQPKNVTDIFGSEGEHLAGPQVDVDSPGDAKQLLVSVDVDLH
jgi:hypothetical protein